MQNLNMHPEIEAVVEEKNWKIIPEEDYPRVYKILHNHNIHSVLVEDENQLVGIVPVHGMIVLSGKVKVKGEDGNPIEKMQEVEIKLDHLEFVPVNDSFSDNFLKEAIENGIRQVFNPSFLAEVMNQVNNPEKPEEQQAQKELWLN